jgi:menaquinol-cytochrome c reductase cytochrome b/c subunit
MNEEHKKSILEKYKAALQKGERFWPDSIYKDLLVSFAIFVILILLATFIGVPGEPKADPSDTSYIPRPEWYFMFLFQMLKYFPGNLEWLGTTIIPGIVILVLLLLPFLDKNPMRYYARRKFALAVMGISVVGIVALTVVAFVTTPPQAEVAVAGTLSEQIIAGQDLYSVNCVECHGADGEGGEVKGVEGFDGVVLAPINTKDLMYTFTDETLANIVAYGQQEKEHAMPPFGRAYGGELSPGEIDYIVTFMRYTWDDRAELPPEAAAASVIPALAAGEVPSYEEHIQLLEKRYCVSCHRAGKKNNNYLMGTYEDTLNTGDNAPVMVSGDMNSILLQVINGTEIKNDKGEVIIHQMPQTKLLKPEYIDMLTRWIMAGMPNTTAEAQALSATAAPAATEQPTSPSVTPTP